MCEQRAQVSAHGCSDFQALRKPERFWVFQENQVTERTPSDWFTKRLHNPSPWGEGAMPISPLPCLLLGKLCVSTLESRVWIRDGRNNLPPLVVFFHCRLTASSSLVVTWYVVYYSQLLYFTSSGTIYSSNLTRLFLFFIPFLVSLFISSAHWGQISHVPFLFARKSLEIVIFFFLLMFSRF